jgi:hypothetical protein
MTGCEIGIGKTFDLGLCLRSMTTGWLPDWAVALLPYWPWLAAIVVLGLAYRIAGLPGITAAAGVIGFILGRRSVPEPGGTGSNQESQSCSHRKKSPPPSSPKRPSPRLS